MPTIKIEIKSIIGNILFEYEKEDNTIKDTLVEAAKQGADLSGAYLRSADLRGAYLSGAYLSGADLSGADLRSADLRGAYLRGADLSGADLSGADLRSAHLRGADLSGADLRGADLSGADLRSAYLRSAHLSGADLRSAKEVPYIPFACPSDGAFIGWKKVHGKLVQLQIPEDARRCSATTQKCRCEKALVLAITDLDGTNPITEIENTALEHHVTYKVGEVVLPDSFDEDRWNEYSHGIHFFINKQDAIDY